MVKPYCGIMPIIHPSAFVEDSAQVIGNVSLEQDASVWCGAVLRGDVNAIRIGKRANVQDGAVLHGTSRNAVIVEDDVTIGHRAIAHGCLVHARCLIGMGAIILDQAEIGEESIIGAGAVVTEKMIVPPRSLILGVPGRVKRMLTPQEIQELAERAARYVEYKHRYISQ